MQTTKTAPISQVKEDASSPYTLSATVPIYVAVEPGYREVRLYGGAAFKFLLTPGMVEAFYFNGTTYTSHKAKIVDKVATTHMPLDGMTTAHYAYFGFQDKIGGLHFTIDGTNKNAVLATLDVEYWNGTAWTDVAGDSDGTDTGGATLNVTGVYTWTVPTDEASTTVSGVEAHWVRFKPSATLSATIDIIEVKPVSRLTAYMQIEATTPERFNLHSVNVSALQVLSVSGTPTLNVGWINNDALVT